MELGVDPGQAGAVEVGVDLGRRDPAVSEELLDHAEVRPSLDEVSREAVAEGVR